MNGNTADVKIKKALDKLQENFDGDIFTEYSYRVLYATDASAYREIPLAVSRPKNTNDIKKLIRFANKNQTSLIPRTAGTSLSGQVVGSGIIVDVSKYMTSILEVNKKDKWVRIQPGVVPDEMNNKLKHLGLFFAPETSTSNRCMIGGMVGNNSCGLHSLIYGSTRDHIISVKVLLSNGSEAEFKALSVDEFNKKCIGNSLENKIYRNIREILGNKENQKNIREEYPDKSIPRRNTGYAIDLLLETEPFSDSKENFNFSKLIAGSEGTLAFITEIKLNLIPLPPPVKAVIPVHCKSVRDALYGNLVALKYNPGAVELMDQTILNLTKDNIEQRKNRFFLKDDPGAVLIVEFARESKEEILEITSKMEKEMRSEKLGYYFPVIFGDNINKVWNLRKAGLGVLSNMPGDAKSVSVVEDTSVAPRKLPDYIDDFEKILKKYNLKCVYHAHVATGELHTRPILNLKDPDHVQIFRKVAEESALLVKKYKGSLSGEHGDGRLRSEFIPIVIGEKNYELLKSIKATWDSNNIFNPGKIVNPPKMNTSLRYEPGKYIKEIDTIFDFSKDQGILRASEKCNGSGDCRKTHFMGGMMCPSYMASRDENKSTRARANTLREFLTNSNKENPFNNSEIYDIMDLCLMCKGCKAECPSSVDITKYKAEFLQHYYDSNGIPLRTRAIAYITILNKIGSFIPTVYNFFVSNIFTSRLMKNILGFAPERSVPKLYKITLKAWTKKNLKKLNPANPKGTVYFFIDEFTQFNDTEIGITAIKLLTNLGYNVQIPCHVQSGRTFLSKGMVRKAKKVANKNISLLKNHIAENTPLIGIEPSGILTFRDEYTELADKELKIDAELLSKNALLIDEFIAKEINNGNIKKDLFTKNSKHIKLHGHCHQKVLASTDATKKMLSFPQNYTVEEIPSGCCGMAGSFGYEKEHYELSMKVGELILFPEIRKSNNKTIIAAPGTSCRQQIKDGTGIKAYHPVEILYEALNLKKKDE